MHKNMHVFNTMAGRSESTPILYYRVRERGNINVSKIKLPIDSLISKAELCREAFTLMKKTNRPDKSQMLPINVCGYLNLVTDLILCLPHK